jgi:hypothetical protein
MRRSQKYLAEKQLQANVDQALARNPAFLENEELRKLQITSRSLAVIRSFRQLDIITLEIQVFSEAPAADEDGGRPEDERARDRDAHDDYSERLDAIPPTTRGGPLLSLNGKLLRPFTLLDSRDRLKKGVFGPGIVFLQ